MTALRKRLPPAPQSTLAELVDAAVAVQECLDVLLSARKLSYPAFLAESLAIAGVKEAEVDEFGRRLDHAGDAAAVGFVSRMEHAFQELNYSRPFAELSKLLRVFGLPEVEGELQRLDGSIAVAQCLAVKRCHRRFGASAFGTIADWDAHQQAIRDATAELAETVARMLASVTASDLMIDPNAVSQDERDRGLCRVTLRAWPSVPYSAPDWPARAIALARRQRVVAAKKAA